MKKIFFILVTLCSINNAVKAQAICQNQTFSTVPTNFVSSLVRRSGPIHSIIYGVDYSNSTLGVHTLYLCDNTLFYGTPIAAPGTPILNYKISFPDGFIRYVYDMKALGDFIYICGRTIDNNGFIGWIKKADFDPTINPSPYFHFVTIPEVTFVKKMVVYDNSSSNPKVAAIGVNDYTNPSGNHRDFYIIELDDASLPSALYQFINMGENNILYEVLYQFNRGVYFIEYSATYNSLGIRKADPSSVLNSSIQTLYYYNTGELEVYSPTHSAIYGNSLAVSYMHGNSSGAYSTRIRYFHPGSLTMTNSQEFAVDNKSEPYDMVYCYNGNHWTPILIQPFSTASSNHSGFIPLEPSYTNPYTCKYYYFPDEIYYSADRYPSHISYYAVGPKSYQYLQNASFNFTLPFSCIQESSVKIGILPLAAQSTDNQIFSIDTNNNYSNISVFNTSEYGQVNCYDD